ncbi:hypothetical protein HEP_00315500, partial [Hepatocystis sp. ex Piliocolobus tephrosceles]
ALANNLFYIFTKSDILLNIISVKVDYGDTKKKLTDKKKNDSNSKNLCVTQVSNLETCIPDAAAFNFNTHILYV